MAASTPAVSVPPALKAVQDQPRVRDFLARAFNEGRLSHAYLFVGAPGSGKHEAALALAQAIVCPNGADGTCDECRRVSHRTHPDVHWYAPGSAQGYLVDQIRQLIGDVYLAPMRADTKVYVVERAELLRAQSANALLKTIEEPPENVVFILCARTVASVLPTIVSRCQVVPFMGISQDAAVESVVRGSGASEQAARIALSVTQTPSRAVEFLASTSRQEVRRLVVDTMSCLARDDSADILKAALDLLEAVKIPLKDVKQAQEDALKETEDYLSSSALKEVEQANKRELSARERSGMMEAVAATESILRDVLMRCEDVTAAPVNEDAAAIVDRIAAATTAKGALLALSACADAANNLAHNVSPQLTLEVMLLSIKEALSCPPSSR